MKSTVYSYPKERSVNNLSTVGIITTSIWLVILISLSVYTSYKSEDTEEDKSRAGSVNPEST
jgi:preprotein translocase subunit SecG